MRTKNEPWLNKNGGFKSDAKISSLGQGWPIKTWKRYLDSSVGTYKDSELVFYPCMDTEEMAENKKDLDFLQDRKHCPYLKLAFKLALEDLSRKERLALKEYFWEGKRTKEIAKELKIKPSTVRVLKSIGLKKLGNILVSRRLRIKIIQSKKKIKAVA